MSKSIPYKKLAPNVTQFKDGIIAEWYKGRRYKKYRVVLYKDMKAYQDRHSYETVSFGDNRYQQYKDTTPLQLYSNQDHKDTKRRDNYQSRHGAQGYQERKYSPAWFSWHFLW